MEWHYVLLIFDAAIIPIGVMVLKAYGDTRARNARQDLLNENTEQHLDDATTVKREISELRTDVKWIKKHLQLNGKEQ